MGHRQNIHFAEVKAVTKLYSLQAKPDERVAARILISVCLYSLGRQALRRSIRLCFDTDSGEINRRVVYAD